MVANHAATLERWARWAPEVRQRGYRPAFAAQNGADEASIPWPELDALFIGGSRECSGCGRAPVLADETCCGRIVEWKESAAARTLGVAASDRGKWVHMGRVNTARRAYRAATFCDSADGTLLAFGADKNVPRLLRMMRRANEPMLFR